MTTATAPADARTSNEPPTAQPAEAAIAAAGWAGRTARRIRRAVTDWWAYTQQPASLAQTWKDSGEIAMNRVPRRLQGLYWLWKASNWADRPALFLVLLLAPTVAQGPLRWCVKRPTRRWGLYAVLVLLYAITHIGS
jgi:hypothetical protein